MKKFNEFFNDLFDFDHWLEPWQSVTILTVAVLLFIGSIISLCIIVK